MQFYEFDRSPGYESLECVDKDAWFDILLALDGSSRAANWKPFQVRRIQKSRRRPFRDSDSPYEGTYVLIFRRSAVDALCELLETHGELLPLEDEDGVELYLYNPRAIDALDQVLSRGSRDEDGRLRNAAIPVFVPARVEGVDIFKIAAPRAGTIYLSDRFVARWKQANLQGLDFKMAWDSDGPLPASEPPEVKKAPSDEYIRIEAYLQGLETTPRLAAMAEQAQKEYATIKAATEARVVQWLWATDTLHSYEPAYFEISKEPPGKVLPGKPDPIPWHAYEYGYDAQGRVVIERVYSEYAGHLYDTYFVHEADGIMSLCPRKRGSDEGDTDKWTAVKWYTMHDGRVTAMHFSNFVGVMGCNTYQYDAQGRVVRRDRREIGALTCIEDWHEIEYDAKGKRLRVHWCYPDGRRYLLFQQVTRKTSFKTLQRQLLEGLTAAIIDGLRKLAITDEVYVFVVRYSEASFEHMLPPCVDVNTAPERERLLKENPDDLECIWNPCEWLPQYCDMLYDVPPDIEALCAVANQDICQNERDKEVLRFLDKLMRALYKADLPIRRSEHFVVIGLIVEEGDCDVQVQTQLPVRARKSLQKAGHLPM